MTTETGELDAEIAGQKISLKNVSINTIATVVTLIGVSLLIYVAYTHQQDSRDSQASFILVIKEQTGAIKESTSIQREQNCLLRFDQKDRQANADFCKQISR